MLAIVPLARIRCFPFSALAIGAMVPDLPMFVPIVAYSDTHSVAGVLHTCMPLGVALFILFQSILKTPLHALLPEYVRQRMAEVATPLMPSSLWFYVGVAVAVALGGYTHLFWDAFSHYGRWGSQTFPTLSERFTLLSVTLPGFKWVQYGSTVMGLPLIVLLAAWQVLSATPTQSTLLTRHQLQTSMKLAAWFSTCSVPLFVGNVMLFQDSNMVQKVGRTITISGAIVMLMVLLFSIGFHATRLNKQASTT